MDYDAWLTKDLDKHWGDSDEQTEELFAEEADDEIRAGLNGGDLNDDLVVDLWDYLSQELTTAEQISIMREALTHKNEALERAIKKVSNVEGLRRYESHLHEAEAEKKRNAEEYAREDYDESRA